MIILSELFGLLATGEFSNINLSRSSTGSLNEREYDRVIRHLNLGIQEIYKRFNLQQDFLTLHVDPTVTKYYLQDARRAIEADIDTTTYIEVDVVDETSEIRLVEVKDIFYNDEDGNLKTHVLNNRFKEPAVLQLAPDVLSVSGLEAADIWTVSYQAYPAKILLTNTFDPDTTYVNIPSFITDALLNFVAWKVFKPMGANSSSDDADKGNLYQQNYELACQKLEMYGLDTQDADEEDTFAQDGWA